MTQLSDIELMISPCCDAFVDFYEGSFICTKCGQEIQKIIENQTIRYKQIFNPSKNALNAEIVNKYNNITKRLAHDPTYTLTSVPCPHCSSKLSRVVRDLEGKKIFVCVECRNIFYPLDTNN